MNNEKSLNFYIFLVFILSIIIFSLYAYFKKIDNNIDERLYRQDIGLLSQIINNATAEGVIVYDAKNNKILAEKNINKKYSLASITKIIVASLVYEKDKNYLNDARSILRNSSNEDTDLLSNSLGESTTTKMSYINDRVKDYNLYFRNPTGLDTEEYLPGGEGDPVAIINFIKDYYNKYPEIFDETLKTEDNTNTIVNDINFLTASKTGYTDLSGGNLFVSIQKGLGRDIFILVLNSTEKNRFVDVQNIVDFLVKSSI